MVVREVVCFASTLPEDIFETEDGEGFLQPPGKSVADAVALIFQKLGFEVRHGPEPANDFVWGLSVVKAGRPFWADLNLVDDYFLTFTNPSWTDKLFGARPKAYLELLDGFSRELGQDPRFSDVRWFKRGEPAHSGGAPSPIGSALRRVHL